MREACLEEAVGTPPVQIRLQYCDLRQIDVCLSRWPKCISHGHLVFVQRAWLTAPEPRDAYGPRRHLL